MLNKMPLRMRLTVITAATLIIVCIIISMFTLVNAEQSMFNRIEVFSGENFSEGPVKGAIIRGTAPAGLETLIQTSRQDFTIRVIATMILLIALGTAAMYFFAGKALKPVTDLSAEIEDINEHNLNKRLTITKFDDEISSLTKSFNGMLEKLEVAFNSQKRFSQNAAHELKTPLTSIMTNIEVLEMDEKPSKKEYKEVIDITKSSTERLIELVDSLLKVNNKGRHVNEEVDVAKMFDDILIELTPIAEKRNISLQVSGTNSVYADVSLLERAFTNLVTNAIRYNNEDGHVEIEIGEKDIIIKDDGIGIEKEKISNIFEPFYCVDDSRSRLRGGTGLGLAIVKEIFDQYGLDYSVKSEVDQGTTIIINIEPLLGKQD